MERIRPQRLRYTHRFERAPASRGVPWIFPPPRVHRIEIEFDPPVPAFEVGAVAVRLRGRQTCPAWVFDGDAWRPATQPESREATVRKLVVFETFEHDMLSSSLRADQERDAAADAAWARENGEELPTVFASLEEHVEAWSREIAPARVHAFGSRAELRAEMERIRAFFAFEWWEDGFHLRVDLTQAPGSTANAPGRDRIREALLALGYGEVRLPGLPRGREPAALQFALPLGIWENPIDARYADEGCALSVVLASSAGLSARDTVDILLRSADRLERELGLVARGAMTGDADLAGVRERVEDSLELLYGDGYFVGGRRVPDIDEDALGALVEERHDLASGDPLRAAGRTLTVRLEAGAAGSALFWAGAVASGLLAVVWTWAALGVVGFVALALLSRPRAAVQDVALGLDELTLTTRGQIERFRLPLRGGPSGTAGPLRDEDGRDVPLVRSPGPASSRLASALFVRSALAARPVPFANRVALEAIFWATEQQPRWAYGRREGVVAASIGDSGALAVFEDQESLDAWKREAPPHRLAFVRIRDDSGKGASLGIPSDVEWCAPLRLNPRDRVFRSEGER